MLIPVKMTTQIGKKNEVANKVGFTKTRMLIALSDALRFLHPSYLDILFYLENLYGRPLTGKISQ